MSYKSNTPPPTKSCPNTGTAGTTARSATRESPNSPAVGLNNGQLSFDIPLMSVAALGAGSWDFSVNYLSGMGVNSLVGLGFNFTQNPVLTLSGTTVNLTTTETVVQSFSQTTTSGSTTYYSSQVALNISGATLVRYNTGLATEYFVLSNADGSTARFYGINSLISTPGQMTSLTDRYGNSQTLTWINTGGAAQLTSVTDSYGRKVNYSYYGPQYNYALQQITDYQGRQVNFQYDTLGHLIAAVGPSINKAPTGGGFPGGTAYVFQYDVNNPRPQRQNDLIAIWYPNQVQPYLNTDSNSSGFRTVDTASVYASVQPRYQMAYGQDPTDTDMWGRVTSVTAGGGSTGVGGAATYVYTSNPADLPENITNPYDPIVFRAIATDRNGNQTTYDFNANQMAVRVEQLPIRSKLTVNNPSFPAPSWITWTVYDANNNETAVIYPEGNSVQYTYESGMVPGLGTPNNFYPPRLGLKTQETRLPGNNYGIPASLQGSNGQQMLTRTYFYDPIYNELCASVEERGNPIAVNNGVNVYFTPQNGSATPTDANRTAYATLTYFDYQKNQTATITNNAQLQSMLGLTSSQITTLINYVNTGMENGGLTVVGSNPPNAFQTNLGDINGDGTGDGASSGLQPAPMVGNTVKIQHPSATVIGTTSTTSQTRIELFTVNAAGQTTTHTDAAGNTTVYVRYPQNDPNGDGNITSGYSANQYGQTREVHVDADPNDVMSLVGASGDLQAFNQSTLINRTNTPGIYQDLITRYEGDNPASTGCVTCAYDPLGNPTAVTDPRGFTSITERNEIGQVYRTISPAPYNFTVETYYDANGNVTRTDTQDMQVLYGSTDPSSPQYGQFIPTGSGYTAHAPMAAGPGGTLRPGWFSNLYTFNILDWKIQDDIDATGSNPSSLTTTYSFDAVGNLIQVTKPEGNIVQYDYDERNLRIAQRVGYVPPNPLTGNPGVAGAVSISIFDNNGNPLASIGPQQRGTVNNSLSATIADAFESATSLTQTGDWVVMNTYDGFQRIIEAMDAVGGNVQNTFDPAGNTIEAQQYGTIGGTTPTDRTGSANQLLAAQITRFDEASRQYESQSNVFLATSTTLASGRAVTHTGGGLASNSTSNNHNQTVTLTTGGQSYVLSRTVYDPADRAIQSIADNTAVTLTAYDGAGRAITVTDPLNNITSTQYDGNSNPILITRTDMATFTQPSGSPNPVIPEVFNSATFYDCLNKPIANAMQGADGNFTTAFTTVEYTATGVDPSTLFAFTGYDSRGNTTAGIDPNGNSTLSVFDGASRLIESQQLQRYNGLGNQGPAGNSTFQSAGRGLIRTQMVYDGNSRMYQMIDDRGSTTNYTFDTLDRQITMEYADGSTESYTYNNASNITQKTDCNGSVFNNTWDCLGRRTAMAITPAAGIGGTISQSFQFDGLSRQTQSSDVTSGGTVQAAFYFDSLSRSVEEAPTTLGLGSRYLTNTAFISYPATQFAYPNNRLVNSGYDALYRRNSIVEQATGASIAAWQFYGPGRIAEIVLGNGLIQTMLNNTRSGSSVQSGVPNPPWGDQSSNRLGYDGSGRMVTKRYLAGGISSGGSTNEYNNPTAVVGQTTAYDHAGNKLFERSLQAQDRSSLYQPVDNSGNFASPIPGYDSVNRLLQYQRGTLSSTGGYQNNGGGSVGTAIALPNTDQNRSYTLDGLGNWKNSTFTAQGALSTGDIRNNNYLNQITQRTLAASPPSLLSYDKNGSTTVMPGGLSYSEAVILSGPSLYWRLDETGGTTAADLSGNGDNGTYSAAGIKYNQPGGLATSANAAVALGATGGTVVNTDTLNFPQLTVAAWVNLPLSAPTTNQMIAGFLQSSSQNTGVLYVDSTNSINWVVNDGTAHTVTSQPIKSQEWYFIVGTADGTTSSLYINGVLVASTAAGNSQTNFTAANFMVNGTGGVYGGSLNATVDEIAAYDFALTAQQVAGLYAAAEVQPQVQLQYDALNRLISVKQASDGATIAAYVYDAMNRRMRKTITNGGVTGNIPNGTTDYIWLGWQVMEERNPFGGSGSTDTPIKQYVWGQYIDECIQLNLLQAAGPQSLPAGNYYLLQDTLYRAVALTNSSGSVVEAYDQDAYGNTLIFTGPGPDGVWFTDDDVQSNYGANSSIYCGYHFDPETENYYVRNRYYSPALGRWLTRDPIGVSGGINLYGYVGGLAPVVVDATGLIGVAKGNGKDAKLIYKSKVGTVRYFKHNWSFSNSLYIRAGVTRANDGILVVEEKVQSVFTPFFSPASDDNTIRLKITMRVTCLPGGFVILDASGKAQAVNGVAAGYIYANERYVDHGSTVVISLKAFGSDDGSGAVQVTGATVGPAGVAISQQGALYQDTIDLGTYVFQCPCSKKK